ncbi:MAG: RagB/SusD family nutrient uptake outer membrane protein [Bacteroidota bacterium]
MKFFNIKLLGTILAFVFAFGMTSCNIEEIPNPNGPTLDDLVEGATLEDLQLLLTGAESVLRNDMEFYYQVVSIVGREYWDLNGVDPRYTGELLGVNGLPLDNNGFLTTRSFAARYRAIKNANVFLESLANSSATLSTEEVNGLTAIVNTFKAYSLLLVLNRQFDNGCRLDVADPDNLGAFVSYEAGLAGVQDLLNEAATNLSNTGDAFALNLSVGFDGFETPAGFRQFVKALQARVALYQGDKASARDFLNESFFDIAGGLNVGPVHAFGTAGNDIRNPLFYVADQDLFIAHPDFMADAEANDLRVSTKTDTLKDEDDIPTSASLDGLSGDFQVQIYSGPSSSVPIIRNEELILIYAEAQIGNDNNEALAAINTIRGAAGIGDYAGGTSDDELLTEIVNQRRYSLFGEGHRWIDLRRLGRLDEINIDRTGDIVHEKFPRPVTENE